MIDNTINNLEEPEFEILFEDLLAQEEIVEKYLKKGPAGRIKSQVRPIKIKMTHRKTGKVFYKTYYVKNTTHAKLRKRGLRDVAKGEKQPRYLTYVDQLDAMFTRKDSMPALFNKTHRGWTDKVTQLSGAYNGALDRFGHQSLIQRKISHRSEPSVNREGNATKIIDTVHMQDMETGTNGRPLHSSITTEATYTDRKDGGVDFHYISRIQDAKLSKLSLQYESNKKVNKEGTDITKNSYSTRVIAGHFGADGKSMTIENAGEYKAHELGYFIAGHERRIQNIHMNITPAKPGELKGVGGGTDHLLAEASWLGFAAKEDTPQNFTSMKVEITKHIQAAYPMGEGAKYTKLLQKSQSMQQYLFHLVDNKRIGRGISNDLISGYIKQIGAKQLHWGGSSKVRTISQHMMNSHNLQKSPENDYHKGYITDYKIESPREAY